MAASTRVERTERLLNLVFCLMAARRPVTRAAIQAAVPGYESDQGDAAFERMFERDKDELRGMGIPVETVLDVNGDVEGYLISTEQYRLPPIDFTPRELAVIALAASVWDEAILAPAAITALRKIEAAGVAAPAHAGDLRMRVQVPASDPALMPMLEAVRERRMVSFDYRSASTGVTARRRVDPWGVVSTAGRWYLVGWDHDRDAERVFRLSRVAGQVRVTATPLTVERDPAVDLTALLAGGQAPDALPTAQVRVAAGQAARLRRMSTTFVDPFEAADIEIAAPSRMQLVSAILGTGAAAVVSGPDDVRAEVVEGLRAVAAVHGGARA